MKMSVTKFDLVLLVLINFSKLITSWNSASIKSVVQLPLHPYEIFWHSDFHFWRESKDETWGLPNL